MPQPRFEGQSCVQSPDLEDDCMLGSRGMHGAVRDPTTAICLSLSDFYALAVIWKLFKISFDGKMGRNVQCL